jgi:hypothetical protein
MTSTRQYLLDLAAQPTHFDLPVAELEPLQLRAAQEVFAQRIEQIPLLKRRADDTGISAIASLEDLVPLLFAHTTYKSYPFAFVDQGRWDRLLKWLSTVSAADVTGVDVNGVEDIDGFIDRLWKSGFEVLATSGTSGKCSIIPRTSADRVIQKRQLQHALRWTGVAPDRSRVFFGLGPRSGPNMFVVCLNMLAEIYGRPDEIHYLTDQPLRVSDVSRSARMRKRMAEGEATPAEIADFERETAAKGAAGMVALQRLADLIVSHRHEPIYMSGQWAQHLAIIHRARELGVGDGEFNLESYVAAGGGVKAIKLPDDYQQQVARFYGPVRSGKQYGMTEMSQLFPMCEKGRYHRPAALILLLLDGAGEKILNRDSGVVEGRYGFVDLALEGRWGGLISGDRVQVDFSTCPCGRPGPTILDTISRWAPPGEDDHIGCAGTLDAYVRTAIDA